jgi:hypothetical protein
MKQVNLKWLTVNSMSRFVRIAYRYIIIFLSSRVTHWPKPGVSVLAPR